MKQFNSIVQSETEPNTNSLWLDEQDTLNVYNNGEWVALSGISDSSNNTPALDSEYYKIISASDSLLDISTIKAGNILKSTEDFCGVVLANAGDYKYIFSINDAKNPEIYRITSNGNETCYSFLRKEDLENIVTFDNLATKNKVGIVQIGSGLNITNEGLLSVDTSNLPTKESVTTNTNNIVTLTNSVSAIDTKVTTLQNKVDTTKQEVLTEVSNTYVTKADYNVGMGLKKLTKAEYDAETKDDNYVYFIKG